MTVDLRNKQLRTQRMTVNGITKTLAAWLAASVAMADVVSEKTAVELDYTNAILRAQEKAISRNGYVWFGPGEYEYSGQLTVSNSTYVHWVGDKAILKCRALVGGARISITSPDVKLEGITFDGNKDVITANAWNVLLFNCNQTEVRKCYFKDGGIGSICNGLTIYGNALASLDQFNFGWHIVEQCRFSGNRDGVWATQSDRVRIKDNKCWENLNAGIRVDTQDAAFLKTNQRVIINDNYCWDNASGISTGNYNKNNASNPLLWDTGFADVKFVTVAHNHCWDNTSYGLAVDSRYTDCDGNICVNNGSAQIIANCDDLSIRGGYLEGNTPWTIDAGGCRRCHVQGVRVRGGGIGISIGACFEGSVKDCDVAGQTYQAIGTTYGESDGSKVAFQVLGRRVTFSGNQIRLGSNSVKGIVVAEGTPDCIVENNDFFIEGSATADTAIYNAVWVVSDTGVIRGNRFDGKPYYTRNPSAGVVDVPDCMDEIHMTTASGALTSIRPRSHSDFYQKIPFAKITHRGVGGATPFIAPYPTRIDFIGGGGSGATADPFYDQEGYLIHCRMLTYGSGYSGVPTPTLIGGSGGGTGCTITPQVGVPILPGKRLRLWSLTSCSITRAGNPVVAGGNTANHTLFVGNKLEFFGRFGQWYVEQQAQGLSIFGAGSPEGAVAAQVGTSYHRTDGGANTTLYVKESGTGNTGWVAK